MRRARSTSISIAISLAISVLLLGTVVRADPEGPRPAPTADAPPAGQAPAMSEVVAGDQLYSAGRFREAAAQYEAAYVLDPRVEILERLANTYDAAGDKARADLIRRRIAFASQPQVPAQPSYTYVPASPLPVVAPLTRAQLRARAGAGLLRTGLGMFAGGYTTAVIAGAVLLSGDTSDGPYYTGGQMMFIPVVGPFLSFNWIQDVEWVAPMVLNGLLQVAGLSMTIAGAAMMGSAKHKPPAVTLAPFSTATTQGMVLSGSF